MPAPTHITNNDAFPGPLGPFSVVGSLHSPTSVGPFAPLPGQEVRVEVTGISCQTESPGFVGVRPNSCLCLGPATSLRWVSHTTPLPPRKGRGCCVWGAPTSVRAVVCCWVVPLMLPYPPPRKGGGGWVASLGCALQWCHFFLGPPPLVRGGGFGGTCGPGLRALGSPSSAGLNPFLPLRTPQAAMPTII